MADLPAPLVSMEVDLRDFGFLPLDVVRLRDSDLATIASGDGFRAAVLLWCVAWHQSPAASVPDDDRMLASYIGYGRDVEAWCKIRVEALRGFVRCSDGRLYHPVLAEKANEAWAAKLARKARTAAANAAKQQNKEAEAKRNAAASGGEPPPPTGGGRDDERNDARDERRDDERNVLQGTGKGQGEVRDRDIIDPSLRSGDAPEDPKPKAGRGSRQATHLPEDWTLSAQDRAYAEKEGLTSDEIERRAEAFRDYWLAKNGPEALKRDWRAAWRTWVRGSDRPTQRTQHMLLPINGGRHPHAPNGASPSRPTSGSASAIAGMDAYPTTRRRESH